MKNTVGLTYPDRIQSRQVGPLVAILLETDPMSTYKKHALQNRVYFLSITMIPQSNFLVNHRKRLKFEVI